MVESAPLRTMIRDRERRDESSDWHDGVCSDCGDELLVLTTTAIEEYDQLCLSCATDHVEDGDLTTLVMEAV